MFVWVLDTSLTLVFAIGQNSEPHYIASQLFRGVLEESCLGNLIHFLKYMLELSYRNKNKITAKYLKMSHFKNVKTKTKKWLLRNFWEKLFQENLSNWVSASSWSLPTLLFGRVCLAHTYFIFLAVLFSRELSQTLAWKFLLYVPQKSFGIYIFPYFVLK